MIESKADLKEYIAQDKFARYGLNPVPISIRIKTRKLYRFNIILRKTEYHINNKHLIRSLLYKYRLLKNGMALGWSIEPNTFGPGLCIVHYGTVVVNGNARIGANARLQAGVNIGSSSGESAAPIIGDNVYFGPGAKIFGDIYIASNTAIAANAVVNKSFYKEGTTIGGIPATVISEKGSGRMIH